LLAAAPEARPGSAREVRGELARLHPAARRTLSDRLRAEVLVGRSQELARIERWLALAPRGAPLLLLSGEMGVGKTTLLREVAVRASLAGRTVVSLSCAAGTGRGEIARALRLRVAAAAGSSAGRDAPERARPDALEAAEPLDASGLPALVAFALACGRELQRQGAGPILLLDDVEHMEQADALSH